MLPRPGTYTDRDDGWITLKHPWFRLAAGELTIDGSRVGRGPGQFRADVPPMASYPFQMNRAGFIPSRLEFSTRGCWKVTARFRSSKVVLYLDVTHAEPAR